MNRALVLAAHGPETPPGRAAFARFVNAVRREGQEFDVHDAYVDVVGPELSEVVAETVGPRIVVPTMLLTDRPVRVDVGRAVQGQPLVSVTAPIGPDWVLAEVGVRRLFEAGARSDDTILLAADAVTDQRAVEDLGQAARLLSAVWGGRVHVGSLGGPHPSLAEAVDVARAYGRRVVLSAYVLTEGRVLDAFRAGGADVVTSPLLDQGPPDPRLVELVLTRARARGTRSPSGDLVHH